MIESSAKLWEDVSVLNNLKFEFIYYDYVPILVARDVFKFPDKVREFFNRGPWWDTEIVKDDSLIRPGKSYLFHKDIVDWVGYPIAKPLSALFGLNYMQTNGINGNCFNGNMRLSDIQSAFPHTDVNDFYPHIAYNINLTQSDKVSTAFYSFNNKTKRIDFSLSDKNEEDDFHKNNAKSLSSNSKWFQIKDYGPWKLEQIVPMGYNSIISYPTTLFHSPYIEEEWFTTSDRITIAGFLNTSPNDLDFKEEHLDDISYAWEFFYLDKIHNYHPKKTKPV
jgi:hypothetical protein